MHIESDIKLDFNDVLIRPRISNIRSRSDVSLIRTFRTPHSNREITCLPIIASNMDTVGRPKMAKALKDFNMLTALHKFVDKEVINKMSIYNNIFISIGEADKDLTWIDDLYNRSISNGFSLNICIDVANGYRNQFLDFVRSTRSRFKNAVIMAGNVCTADMTQQLYFAGADIIKIGIGSGGVCETRLKTGVGYPQLSAIIECATAAHNNNALICSDGGCRTPADVAKAFAAGSDFVMLGSMFSGHDECITEDTKVVTLSDGSEGIEFRGMSSKEAMEHRYGKMEKYRSSEGKAVIVRRRGPVSTTVEDLLGGIRSTCTYVGADKLKNLSKNTTFIRVNRQYDNLHSVK